MKKLNLKIFNKNLNNNVQTINLMKKVSDVGKKKYFPSYTKEWKSSIYSFNANNIKNLPINDLNLNKLIKSYFNLYYKNNNVTLVKKRKFLRRIYVSNVEIKYTNLKSIITLYIYNRERFIFKNHYLRKTLNLSNMLMKRFFSLYYKHLTDLYNPIDNQYKDKYFFSTGEISKKMYLNHKFNFLVRFVDLINLYKKKIWSIVLLNSFVEYNNQWKKYHLVYNLNKYKFNKLFLLPKLSNILTKIIGKKIEYNFINLKSLVYNTDIFTHALALKISKDKKSYRKNMSTILNRAKLPIVNTIQERSIVKSMDPLLEKFKDLKLISNLSADKSTNIDGVLKNIHSISETGDNSLEVKEKVFNSIKYKNMGGIRLEISGRLTPRYRADRSVHSLRLKGGLKNIDSSYKGMTTVLFRGNTNSNTSYSMFVSKRRIGAFAVKGWISGK
jgi:hypothetical protein